MNKGRIFDIAFMLLSFGVYVILLNLDEHIDDCSFVCRHFWLPLIIAYYIGRFVSQYSGKKKA